MRKRITSFVLAMVLLISTIPTHALADGIEMWSPPLRGDVIATPTVDTTKPESTSEPASRGYENVTDSGTTGDCIWTLYDTELFIDGKGAMRDYSSTSTLPWGTSITKVTFGSDVTHIGRFAFNGCENIKEIIIPDNIATIGAGAFYGCVRLTHIRLSQNIKTIEAETFYECRKLTQISIPEGVTHIKALAFSKCNNVGEVTLPNSIAEIAIDAFSGCTKLAYSQYDCGYYLGNSTNPYLYLYLVAGQYITTLDVHDDTRVIGNRAAQACDSLTSVTIGDSVTHIC